jgi:hypothetical protein
MSGTLACPSCAETYDLDERFCPRCGMPLVYAGVRGLEHPVTDQHERVRKIKPQYAQGELVRVAVARQQAEGEFIQGLLLEEGIPSLLRRTGGFDVPDFLAAGPRDVVVPEAGAEAAREVLLQAEIVSSDAQPTGPRPLRLLLVLLGAVVVLAIVVVILAAIAKPV